MVTIKDVAKKANVSTSTVSKVLKGYENISETTKNNVLNAVSDLGYVPNAMASALSSKNYNRVGIWININNQRQAIDELNMQYIFGSFSKAKEINMNVKPLFSQMFVDMNKQELLTYLKSEGINALIVFGLTINNGHLIEIIEQEEINCVVVDAPKPNSHTTSISVDNALAQYEVARMIVDKYACKKILYLAGRKDGFVTFKRIEGINRLGNDVNLKIDIEYANYSELNAREITLAIGSNYDAIICASDMMAIGAKNALKSMNIKLPVTGFDGITLLGYINDDMYTVKQDFYHFGEVAITEIDSLLKGEKGKQVILPHSIVKIEYEDVIS